MISSRRARVAGSAQVCLFSDAHHGAMIVATDTHERERGSDTRVDRMIRLHDLGGTSAVTVATR